MIFEWNMKRNVDLRFPTLNGEGEETPYCLTYSIFINPNLVCLYLNKNLPSSLQIISTINHNFLTTWSSSYLFLINFQIELFQTGNEEKGRGKSNKSPFLGREKMYTQNYQWIMRVCTVSMYKIWNLKWWWERMRM